MSTEQDRYRDLGMIEAEMFHRLRRLERRMQEAARRDAAITKRAQQLAVEEFDRIDSHEGNQ